MNNHPLISLIIPCYNAERSLEKCLNSVVHQSYTNLEIILVDDGSTDGTSTIYKDFESRDVRIKIIKQENSGVSKARNKGVKTATGEYICFVDSDDWVESDYCSELYHSLIEENADIAIVEASYEDADGNIVFTKPTSEEKIIDGKRALALLLEDHVIQSHPWGKLYKVAFFNNVNFPENLKCFEDYSTLFKIFDKAVKVVKSNRQLYHYIQHGDSLSHNLSPETAYHFYLSIMDVFRFWQSTTEVKNDPKITKNIVRKLLMVLKRILRQTNKNEMKTEKEQIRKSFKSFLKYPAANIGLEYYFYLRLYYYSPDLYTKIISKK
ncbi:glycosyltransferase [Epilithonimonas sp. JDS]|uniref:glycosyltransferase family 2 protein n=1 Tax=Epilithonimonas sp. JDS TaxID=2902797 RepID=UPI001E397C06|nr:glycosyltransferase [Epilithonimonas sp. JDS]MCD9856097.1 glycosyltransferase [Epilithonimonas sp. JDS]